MCAHPRAALTGGAMSPCGDDRTSIASDLKLRSSLVAANVWKSEDSAEAGAS